jgi:hypothetical protein
VHLLLLHLKRLNLLPKIRDRAPHPLKDLPQLLIFRLLEQEEHLLHLWQRKLQLKKM